MEPLIEACHVFDIYRPSDPRAYLEKVIDALKNERLALRPIEHQEQPGIIKICCHEESGCL